MDENNPLLIYVPIILSMIVVCLLFLAVTGWIDRGVNRWYNFEDVIIYDNYEDRVMSDEEIEAWVLEQDLFAAYSSAKRTEVLKKLSQKK